jgi:pSer/pThr/pTyr-binding forkhead associated (FHA) protein
VVPKALSPFADEDEKTTIESGWEEEASTTVEQGEVAEKIRTLGLRPITNVTGSTPGQDEPTMDDQHANAALSMMTPAAVHARMIITAGSDRGQEIDIIPGKTYTVGRAIDNDIVLSDIAVSRKHFDLRFENSAWVLVDRGSGNGTVINGNIEDAPFMLANGDSIEIGNTTFRYDNPNSVPRNAFQDSVGTNGFNHTGDIVTRNANSFEVDMEEEPSTVAGKPLRSDQLRIPEPAALHSSLAPPRPASENRRPRTVPPPMPPPAPLPRPKAASAAPTMMPFGPPNAPPGSMPMMQPPPMQQMHPQMHHSAPQVPAIGSSRPTMLAHTPSPQMHMMHPPHEVQALANVMPTTIPGQGPPMQPSQPQIHALPFTYPNMAEHVQHVQSSQHVQHVQSSQHAKMLISTNQQLRDATATAHVPPTPYNGLPVMQPYVAPTLSRRTKLLLGGAGLTVLAAIATIAIIKGASGGEAEPEVKVDPPKTGSATTTTKTAPTATPIDSKKDPKATKPLDKKVVDAKTPPKDVKTAVVEAPKDVKVTAKDPPKDPPKDVKVTAKDPPKDPPKDVKVTAKDPPKDPPKDVKVTAKDPPKDPPKKDPKTVVAIKKDPPKKDPPKKDPPKKEPKQVAVADSSGALDKAKALYRDKKFLEAAAAAKGADRNVSGLYAQLATAYNNGTRPSAKPAAAWTSLRSALTFDRQLGGAHAAEIQAKQSSIAAQAAVGFASAKNMSEALAAVKVAEAAGADTSLTRRLISDYALELYTAAKEEIDSNRTAALAKLRQVKSLLPPTNTTYTKADKLLNANGG